MRRGETIGRPRRRRRRWPIAAGVAVGAAGLGAALFLVLQDAGWYDHVPPPAPVPSTLPPAPPPTAPPPAVLPEAPPLPPLAESDAVVRELAAGVSPHPALTQWLVSGHVLQRFVAAVDNVADGESPRGHLGFLAPTGSFQTATREGRTYADPASYERYTAVAEVVASLDAAECVALYRRVQPLADAAYRELGRTDRTFDAALRQAIARLLETPVPDGEVALRPRVTTWAFVDRRLEALSPAQKHLLRLGPRNARLVQEKLREIAAALDAGGSP